MELDLQLEDLSEEDKECVLPKHFQLYDRAVTLCSTARLDCDLRDLHHLVEELEDFYDHLTVLRDKLEKRADALRRQQLEGWEPHLNALRTTLDALMVHSPELKAEEDSIREKLNLITDKISLVKETKRNAKILDIPHLADVEAMLADLRLERDKIVEEELNCIVSRRNTLKEDAKQIQALMGSIGEHVGEETDSWDDNRRSRGSHSSYLLMLKTVQCISSLPDNCGKALSKFLENLRNVSKIEEGCRRDCYRISSSLLKVQLVVMSLVSSYWKH